jgi:predicted DNA-binding transcriptional regulator
LSKDQVLGGVILAVCVIVAAGYIVIVSIPSYMGLDPSATRLDAVLILVSIAFIAILAIGAWIGYTMATTPPPKTIEEITAETKAEDKTEEPKT